MGRKVRLIDFRVASLLVFVAAGQCAHAMQSLDDGALAQVNGQDGISVLLETAAAGMTVDSMRLALDPTVPAREVDLVQSGIKLSNVNELGVAAGSAFVGHTLDVGSDGTNPYLSYKLEIYGQTDGDGGKRARLALGELSHGDANSYGSWALDGEGVLQVVNRGGPFNVAANDAYLFGQLSNARLYYRQLSATDPDRAYLIMDNLDAKWEMPAGTLGINADGIKMATTGTIDVALDADMFFKTGGDDFTPGGRGLQHFGWLGQLKDAELLWRTRDASDPNRPGVLNLSSRWNYTTEEDASSYEEVFRWRLGETGGTASPAIGNKRMMFETSDWIPWGDHAYGHNFPLIGLDVIAGTRIGPTDHQLCWGAPNVNDGSAFSCAGGQAVNLEPGRVGGASSKGLALMIRDGNLQTYSRRINVLEQVWDGTEYATRIRTPGEPYASPDVSYSINWGLIYTFANVDGSIYLYPGGNPSDATKGLRADILLMSQSFDATEKQGFNWNHGSHLMIADTNIDGLPDPGARSRNAMGIGFMSTSFLVMADDTTIALKPTTGADYYSGGVDITSYKTRVAMNTNFGGGILFDNSGGYGTGPRYVRGSIITSNFEGAANFRLSPSDPADSAKNYLGYSWAVRLMTLSNDLGTEQKGFGESPYGSHISLAEPSSPDVAIRLAGLSGDIAFTEGKIDLMSGSEGKNNKPALKISHNMLLGYAAINRINDGLPNLSATQQVVKVDNLALGDKTLGRIVIPSGKAYASMTLEPKQVLPSP